MRNEFRHAQYEQAAKNTEAAKEHDLPHMRNKEVVYYNAYMDGFYGGVEWVRDHLTALLEGPVGEAD